VSQQLPWCQLLTHAFGVLHVTSAGAAGWVDRFSGKARKGCDILVQALEREVRSGTAAARYWC
jgi:hypothetical protein